MNGLGSPVSLLERLKDMLSGGGRVIAALDGRSASGKTTAANWLAEQLDGEVIHMDDFFLPPELRTPERLAQPGGNVHYERFAQEVIAGLAGGEVFEYRVFDCSVMDYGGTVTVGSKRLIVVEGAYSLHPYFGRYYDLAAFFHVEPDEQKQRILARNGPGKLIAFTEKWIPLEEAYITSCSVEARCDLTVGREQN